MPFFEGETLSVYSIPVEAESMYSVYSIAIEGDLCILCILLQGRGRVFRKPGAVVLLPASGKFPTQPIFLLLFKWNSQGEIITLNNSTPKHSRISKINIFLLKICLLLFLIFKAVG